jgi:surface carbohydrate biosynthesis protein
MKPIALIHIDALRREYSSVWLLSKYLERNGFKVILSSRSSTTYLLKLFTPNLLILSHPFTITNKLLEKLRKKGTKIIITEVEGIVRVEHDISATYPEYIKFDNFDIVYVWNQWSKDWLKKNRSLGSCKVEVSGCIRNDLIKFIDSSRKDDRIGIIGRYELINSFDSRHNFENLRYMEQRHIERWHVDLDSFLVVRDLTKYLLSKGYKVSFRPHPNENVKSYQILKDFFGDGFEINEGFDYYEWLGTLDKVVGTVSSAFLEPYLAEIPTICIDSLFDYKGPPNLEEWRKLTREGSYLPKNSKELYSLCLDKELKPKTSKKLNQYLMDLYSIDDAQNSNTTVNVVNHLVTNLQGLKKSSAIKILYVDIIKVFLEILVLIRCMVQNTGAWSMQNLRQYDYNSLIHGPSRFMKFYYKTLFGK